MNFQLKKYLEDKKNILSIYFTAEYPVKGSTVEIIEALANAGADMIEVGIPFSDPLADGPVIQESSKIALENGFLLDNLFADLNKITPQINIPLVMMGYFNTVLAFGVEKFLKKCNEIKIEAVILPDLPPEIYQKKYLNLFQKYNVAPVFLVSPQTTTERLAYINSLSNVFIYAVADNSITGSKNEFSASQITYFKRIKNYAFNVPVLIGFGISNKKSYTEASNYANGVIIGSAFIKALTTSKNITTNIQEFIATLKN